VKGAAPKGLAVRKREVTKQAKNFVVVLEGVEKAHSLLAKFGPANLNSPERVKKHGVANEARAGRWPPGVWKNAGAHRLLFGHLKGRDGEFASGGGVLAARAHFLKRIAPPPPPPQTPPPPGPPPPPPRPPHRGTPRNHPARALPTPTGCPPGTRRGFESL
jgi:hypothetical protein